MNDRSKSQSQQATRTRGPPIRDQCAVHAVFLRGRGRNGREAVHVARPLNGAFSGGLCMRAWWWRTTTASLLPCGSLLVPRGLSGVAKVMDAGDVEAPHDARPLFSPSPAGNNALRALGGQHVTRLRHFCDPALAPALSCIFLRLAPRLDCTSPLHCPFLMWKKTTKAAVQ